MGDKGIKGAIHELEDFLLRIKTMVENAPSLPTSQTE
jgi:hypothetical protein